MIRFLALFPQFRALRKRLKVALRRCGTLERENLALVAKQATAEQQILDLWGRLDSARVSEIESTQKAADYFARRYGRPMYNLASEVPERDFENQKPVEKTRQQASTLVNEADRRFREQIQAMQQQKHATAAEGVGQQAVPAN